MSRGSRPRIDAGFLCSTPSDCSLRKGSSPSPKLLRRVCCCLCCGGHVTSPPAACGLGRDGCYWIRNTESLYPQDNLLREHSVSPGAPHFSRIAQKCFVGAARNHHGYLRCRTSPRVLPAQARPLRLIPTDRTAFSLPLSPFPSISAWSRKEAVSTGTAGSQRLLIQSSGDPPKSTAGCAV